MLFVFGSTFICGDAQAAKKITFDPAVYTRSVTLDGDVYEPSGSLSGGSAPSNNKILIDVQKLLECEGELNSLKRELQEVEREEASVRNVREEWRRLVREVEIREHELRCVEEQVGGSNASRVSLLPMRVFLELSWYWDRLLRTSPKLKGTSKNSRMRYKLREISNRMRKRNARNSRGI
jgi:structural maintenance of chromosome 2